jgi:hypothetical protein
MPTLWQIFETASWPLVCPAGGEHETIDASAAFCRVHTANYCIEQHTCKKCGAVFQWKRQIRKPPASADGVENALP